MRKIPVLPCSFIKYSLIYIGLGCFLFSMMSCSGGLLGLFKSKDAKELEITPEALIQEGLNAYQRKKYTKATEAFQKMKDRFPYNPYAIVAELKLADSYFLNKEYLLAATAYKEFEKLHPTNEIIPYVIFQLGMCYFKQMPTTDRDQSYAFQAAQAFDRLIKTYPKSEYVSQAQPHWITAQKKLALHEFYVGEYYFNGKKYEAALGRFEGVVQQFPNLAHPPKLEQYIRICKEKLDRAQSQKNKKP
jgi:outer membrane protein assembly factor BamD